MNDVRRTCRCNLCNHFGDEHRRKHGSFQQLGRKQRRCEKKSWHKFYYLSQSFDNFFDLTVSYYKKWKYTPAVRSKISSKLIFARCVWYSDHAHYELCVLMKDMGRRLPLQLQCSYQGQQGDFSQSVRWNYKARFWGGQNLTAVEGNASVYQSQVNTVSRVTGEGTAEVWRTLEPGFDQNGAGVGGGGQLHSCVETTNPSRG